MGERASIEPLQKHEKTVKCELVYILSSNDDGLAEPGRRQHTPRGEDTIPVADGVLNTKLEPVPSNRKCHITRKGIRLTVGSNRGDRR
jgi:hypothetical protein